MLARFFGVATCAASVLVACALTGCPRTPNLTPSTLILSDTTHDFALDEGEWTFQVWPREPVSSLQTIAVTTGHDWIQVVVGDATTSGPDDPASVSILVERSLVPEEMRAGDVQVSLPGEEPATVHIRIPSLWRESYVQVGERPTSEFARAMVADQLGGFYVLGETAYHEVLPEELQGRFVQAHDVNGHVAWRVYPHVLADNVGSATSNSLWPVSGGVRVLADRLTYSIPDFIPSRTFTHVDLDRTGAVIQTGDVPGADGTTTEEVRVVRNGNYLVLDLLEDGGYASPSSYQLSEYDEGGSRLWRSASFTMRYSIRGVSFVPLAEGGCVYWRSGGEEGAYLEEIVRVGADGAEQWAMERQAPNSYFMQFVARENGGFFLVQEEFYPSPMPWSADNGEWIRHGIRIDAFTAEGLRLWSAVLPKELSEEFAATRDGGIVMTGETNVAAEGEAPDSRSVITRLDGEGGIVFRTTAPDHANAVYKYAVDHDAGVATAGIVCRNALEGRSTLWHSDLAVSFFNQEGTVTDAVTHNAGTEQYDPTFAFMQGVVPVHGGGSILAQIQGGPWYTSFLVGVDARGMQQWVREVGPGLIGRGRPHPDGGAIFELRCQPSSDHTCFRRVDKHGNTLWSRGGHVPVTTSSAGSRLWGILPNGNVVVHQPNSLAMIDVNGAWLASVDLPYYTFYESGAIVPISNTVVRFPRPSNLTSAERQMEIVQVDFETRLAKTIPVHESVDERFGELYVHPHDGTYLLTRCYIPQAGYRYIVRHIGSDDSIVWKTVVNLDRPAAIDDAALVGSDGVLRFSLRYYDNDGSYPGTSTLVAVSPEGDILLQREYPKGLTIKEMVLDNGDILMIIHTEDGDALQRTTMDGVVRLSEFE